MNNQKFSLPLLLSLVMLIASSNVHAIRAGFDLQLSQEFKRLCITEGKSEVICEWLALLEDPIGEGIEQVNTTLQYDPSKWRFQSELSGFMCEFSDGGTCIPANPRYGRHLVEDVLDPIFGPPVSGSTFSLQEQIPGIIELSVAFGSPVEVTEDTNMFGFVFEPVDLSLDQPLYADYFFADDIGDFKQQSSCSTSEERACGSSTPIGSSTITGVPTPSTIAMISIALLGLLFSRKLNSPRSGSFQSNCPKTCV